MIRLVETGRAKSLVGQLVLCAKLISNQSKRSDLKAEDRTTLIELNNQRIAYALLLGEAQAETAAALGEFDKVLDAIEEFCDIVQQGLDLSNVVGGDGKNIALDESAAKFGSTDAGLILVKRLQSCSERLEDAFSDERLSANDIDTLRELQTQSTIYRKAVADFSSQGGATAGAFAGVLSDVDLFCSLIEGRFPAFSEGRMQ